MQNTNQSQKENVYPAKLASSERSRVIPASRPSVSSSVIPAPLSNGVNSSGILSSPLLVVLFFTVVLGLGIFLGKTFFSSAKQNSGVPTTPTSVVSSPSVQPTVDPTANWKIYDNETYGFSFKYPNSWIELTTEAEKMRGNPGQTNNYTTIETDKKEIISVTVFDGKANKSNDKSWAKNIDIGNNKSVLITYVQCMGPGCLEGQKDIELFDQIFSTFKFTEKINGSPTPEAVTEGEATVSGYYFQYEKTMFETTGTCDAFIVENGEDQPIIKGLIQWVNEGNTVNRLTSDNKLIMNLNLKSIDENSNNKIISSSKNNLVTIKVERLPPYGRGASLCESFVNILSVN